MKKCYEIGMHLHVCDKGDVAHIPAVSVGWTDKAGGVPEDMSYGFLNSVHVREIGFVSIHLFHVKALQYLIVVCLIRPP